jgi:hypothetical protein
VRDRDIGGGRRKEEEGRREEEGGGGREGGGGGGGGRVREDPYLLKINMVDMFHYGIHPDSFTGRKGNTMYKRRREEVGGRRREGEWRREGRREEAYLFKINTVNVLHNGIDPDEIIGGKGNALSYELVLLVHSFSNGLG